MGDWMEASAEFGVDRSLYLAQNPPPAAQCPIPDTDLECAFITSYTQCFPGDNGNTGNTDNTGGLCTCMLCTCLRYLSITA
jgi:hypothetical protein